MIFCSLCIHRCVIFSCKFYIIIQRYTKKLFSSGMTHELTLGSLNLNSSFAGSLISCCRCISRISALAELLMLADDETFHSKGSLELLRLKLFIEVMSMSSFTERQSDYCRSDGIVAIS